MNDYESEKKKGLLSSLFDGKTEESRQPPLNDERTSTTIGNGEQVDGENVDKAPPPIVISGKRSDKDKITKELLRQKTELEREKTLDRQVIQEKTQQINVTMEINVLMQKELDEKDETIRMLEDKNRALKRTIDAKVDELETLKQQASLLEQELSSRSAGEKKLLEEKKELLANINLHGWLCKRGIKGPTADVWRQRYFKLEEGNKLKYYKKPTEGSAQGYIDIDKIISVKQIPEVQQNNFIFHVVTKGRTYELLVSDEATMNKWVSSLQYIKEWRAKRKQEVNH